MTILPVLLAGDFPHKIEAVFFAGFDSPIRLRLFFFFCWARFPHNIEAVFGWVRRGFLWVRIMGSQNVIGTGYGSNISGRSYPGSRSNNAQ